MCVDWVGLDRRGVLILPISPNFPSRQRCELECYRIVANLVLRATCGTPIYQYITGVDGGKLGTARFPAATPTTSKKDRIITFSEGATRK